MCCTRLAEYTGRKKDARIRHLLQCIISRHFTCDKISTGHTSVDIGASANLEVVDMFCYLVRMEMLMQLWRPESELNGINSGSWYHCLPIGIYH